MTCAIFNIFQFSRKHLFILFYKLFGALLLVASHLTCDLFNLLFTGRILPFCLGFSSLLPSPLLPPSSFLFIVIRSLSSSYSICRFLILFIKCVANTGVIHIVVQYCSSDSYGREFMQIYAVFSVASMFIQITCASTMLLYQLFEYVLTPTTLY